MSRSSLARLARILVITAAVTVLGAMAALEYHAQPAIGAAIGAVFGVFVARRD